MAITLHPDQEAALKSRVARGDFAPLEEAARRLIDEALAEAERGEVITRADHEARIEARLAAMK